MSVQARKPGSRGVGRQVRLYAVVTFVAAMVWVVAEGHTLQRQTVDMRLELRSSASHLVVSEEDNWTGVIRVSLEGSAAASADAAGLTGATLAVEAGQAGVPLEPGRHVVDMRALLRDLLAQRNDGLSVVAVEPPTVAVRVSELQLVEREVTVVLPDGIEASSIEVSPPRVTLASAAGVLGEQTIARVQIDAPSLSGQPVGQPLTLVEEPVHAVDRQTGVGIDAMARPGTVSVTLTLQTRAQQWVIPTLPVVVQLAPTELSRWDVVIPEPDRVLRNVTLTGPGPLIDLYRRGDRRLSAVVSLGFEELERGIDRKDVEFVGLLPGVTASVEDREIRVTITPR